MDFCSREHACGLDRSQLHSDEGPLNRRGGRGGMAWGGFDAASSVAAPKLTPGAERPWRLIRLSDEERGT